MPRPAGKPIVVAGTVAAKRKPAPGVPADRLCAKRRGGTHVPRRRNTPMPQTKTQRSAAARKAAATRKRRAAEAKEPEHAGAAERTIELS